MKLKDKDKKYLGRGDISSIPIEIVSSKGSFLFGPNGERYIDFLMGWCVGNIGWGVEEVLTKVKNFKGPDYVNPYYLYKPWAELAALLAKITPGKLVKSFRATGGTEAVEIALQTAMTHTKRSKFVSIENAYHGHSIAAMSIGSSAFRGHYYNLLPGCYKIKPPLDEKAGLEVERILSKGDVAAFITEPIICNLGVVIPKQEFFDIVKKACQRYGTLLIIDEVATGFGRTGKLFASDHYNLQPDIMCLGKGLTCGYGVMGVTITTEEVARSMEFNFSFYSTFGWHPRNVAAAIANIRYLLKWEEKILRNVSQMSQYFKERLKRMKFKDKAQIRIKGLAIGIEFKREDYAGETVAKCLEKKLLISVEVDPHIITIFPSLNIDKKTAKEGLDIFEACL